MSGHTIRWTLQPAAVVATVECHEPVGADCRRACDCENTPDPVEVCEVCRAPIRVIDCNPSEWIENTDGWVGHYVGPATPLTDGPIEFVWDGDDWTWLYAEERDMSDVGDAYLVGYIAGAGMTDQSVVDAIFEAGRVFEREQIVAFVESLSEVAVYRVSGHTIYRALSPAEIAAKIREQT